MNICGCLVHIAPGQEAAARTALTTAEGVEVHAESDDGRFVIVVEDTETALASETIMDLHQIPGVISLTLTYHHFEDATARRSCPPDHVPQPAGGQTNDHF